MHLNFRLMDASDTLSATTRQADAVALFFETDFGELTDGQANALLSCREFARLSARAIFPKWANPTQNLVARAIAAFILSDDEMVEFVVRWSNNSFARGSSSPRVRGAPIFADVDAFATYLEGALQMLGWTSKLLQGNFSN